MHDHRGIAPHPMCSLDDDGQPGLCGDCERSDCIVCAVSAPRCARGEDLDCAECNPDALPTPCVCLPDSEPDVPDELVVECVVELANGRTIRTDSFERNPAGSSYVRVCAPDGAEIVYWSVDEWRDDPELVMGALVGACTTAGHSSVTPDPRPLRGGV